VSTLSRVRRPGIWLAVGVLTAAGIFGLFLVVRYLTQTTVTLNISGYILRVHTRADTVQAALDDAHILVDPEDVVSPVPNAPLKNGMTITIRKAYAVAVEAGGEVRHVRTQLTHPLDILSEQGIQPGTFDIIRVDGQDFSYESIQQHSWDTAPQNIHLIHSVKVTVMDGAQVQALHTSQVDIGRALDTAGISLYLADKVIPDFSTPISDGMVIRIQRSNPVTVLVDGHTLTTRAVGPTVGDALAAIGIAPIGEDYTIPPLDAAIAPDMTIRVVRVTEAVIIEHETIAYSSHYRPDPALASGEKRVIEDGVPGLRELYIRIRYEDGKEVSRMIEEERVIRLPEARLVFYGPRANSYE